jgi:hypothetical protein
MLSEIYFFRGGVMKKTKKQRIKKVLLQAHKGALKLCFCGIFLRNLKIFNSGHTTFKRKNNKIIVDNIR